MLAHQQRVVDEKSDLDDKAAKLSGFLDSSIFQSLDWREQGRLREQLAVMKRYSAILGERIENF